MINEFGLNLDIVILTETGQDWQAFATWYSIWKNLPEAKIQIVCRRNQQAPFQYFQWVHRMKVSLAHIAADAPTEPLYLVHTLEEHKLRSSNNILLVDCCTLCVDVFDNRTLSILNDPSYDILQNQNTFFSHLNKHSDAWENHQLLGNSQCRYNDNVLVHEAKDSNSVFPLISIRKGCGRWIDTLKGCPLANASGLISESMTANENRVIELWRKMATLYSAVQ